jgi:hypothetical protein
MSRMLAPMGANVGSGDSGWRRFVGLGSAADDLTSKTAASASLFSTAALLFRPLATASFFAPRHHARSS